MADRTLWQIYKIKSEACVSLRSLDSERREERNKQRICFNANVLEIRLKKLSKFINYINNYVFITITALILFRIIFPVSCITTKILIQYA